MSVLAKIASAVRVAVFGLGYLLVYVPAAVESLFERLGRTNRILAMVTLAQSVLLLVLPLTLGTRVSARWIDFYGTFPPAMELALNTPAAFWVSGLGVALIVVASRFSSVRTGSWLVRAAFAMTTVSLVSYFWATLCLPSTGFICRTIIK